MIGRQIKMEELIFPHFLWFDDTSSDALHDNHIFVVESIKLLFQLSAASAFYFVTGRQENFINRHIK